MCKGRSEEAEREGIGGWSLALKLRLMLLLVSSHTIEVEAAFSVITIIEYVKNHPRIPVEYFWFE